MSDTLPRDGLVAVVKRDCPTCVLAAPVLAELAAQGGIVVYTQDDPSFPEAIANRIDDLTLDISHRLGIEIVPTLIRFQDGQEIGRTYGWDRAEWERISGFQGIGADLPAFRPGCGAKNQDPGVLEQLKIRFGETGLSARQIEIGDDEDEFEAMFERGWSDGLPVVPPTRERVMRMLAGTVRDPKEVLGLCPPNLIPATVEKIAINAVMAGCKPEYLPVVLAAIEAVLDPAFAMHGVLATTMFVGPVVVVNGPIRRQIGMNGRGNALGQGNRANATIGRAVQLVIRNVGGGRPQEVDRATLGNPGKYTYCFAEEPDPVHGRLATGDPQSQNLPGLRRHPGRLPGARAHLPPRRLEQAAGIGRASGAVLRPSRSIVARHRRDRGRLTADHGGQNRA